MKTSQKVIKVQFKIDANLYHQLKQSDITGNIDDALATKLRALINKYT